MPTIRGETVFLLRPVEGEPDAMGEPSLTWARESVENVLPDPGSSGMASGSSRDLDASRPDGVLTSMTFHFPKSYEAGLRGCKVEWRGRVFRVVGDPVPYAEGNAPGRWNRAVGCEACDG